MLDLLLRDTLYIPRFQNADFFHRYILQQKNIFRLP